MKITPEKIIQTPGRISEVRANAEGIYWLQQIPAEKGRTVLMHRTDKGPAVCLTPAGESVGNRVNGYGGGSYCLIEGRSVFSPGGIFADPTPINNHFICVREEGNTQSLVEITPSGDLVRTLHDQHDFYAAPRYNPGTHELAFIAWDLPSMPWDGTTLYLMNLADQAQQVLQENRPTFQSQPTWYQNKLFFISDRSDFGELMVFDHQSIQTVCQNWPSDADAAMPLWMLGMQTFLPLGDERFAIIYSRAGWYYLGLIENGIHRECDLPFCAFGDQLALWHDKLVFSAATPTESFAVRLLDLHTLAHQTISEMPAPLLEPHEIALPEPLIFPSSGGALAHAFFYRPKQANPPLIVMSHGGPTFYTNAGYSNKIQFWVQQGFAVVDVNYRGSTGFGRAYWEALKHCWGDSDAKDVIAAAEYLVAQGWVNPEKLFIRGSSAGGFLSLCAMAASDCFKAGAIYYGVSDLSAFMNQTHRFESGYNDWLVGKTVKSPVEQLDKFTRPIIFFHGLKDTVVPLSHSQVLYEAMLDNNVETALHTYPDEGHSFRAAETVIDSMEKELAFFKQFL